MRHGFFPWMSARTLAQDALVHTAQVLAQLPALLKIAQ
jgi:hypothetical protein